MNKVVHSIESLKKEFITALQAVTTEQELEQVRITYLSRQGSIANLMSGLKNLSIEEKRILGPQLNTLKTWADTLFIEKQETLLVEQERNNQLRKQYFDVTASLYTPFKGSLHIYTQCIQQMHDIFISMGYDIADGPEVETDYYNFQALNIPADHPARDAHDTFWLDVPSLLLRTHTSSVQIHAMESRTPPLALFAPGRSYRNEATDASHDFMFTQGEGLVIGRSISIANLLATAQEFLGAFFEKKDLKIRVRPGYFPFVEPGVEIDASCPFCTKGCSVCKKTTWIELLGAGLVHPNVLRCSGIDPEIYSGFAFGFGFERLAMVKYGINDIRLFHSSKLPFLEQFS